MSGDQGNIGFADLDGLRIAYRRAGVGPLLMLVHGAVCDGRVWRRQIDDLSDGFGVVAWDAPGCGQSTDPPESYRLRDYADALAGLISELGDDRAHVVGHSFGGALALELAHRHPAAVRSLVLLGAYAGWAGSLAPEEVQRRLGFALDTASRLPGGFEPASMPGLFTEAMGADTVDELAMIMSASRPVATRAMAHALAEADLRDELPRIAVPTLLLHGDADQRSSPAVGRSLRDGIPHSRLVVLPGLGHCSFLEDPGRVTAEIRTFLHEVA
jgi:pimeloyl-ACP methyl ester carboxylesterase